MAKTVWDFLKNTWLHGTGLHENANDGRWQWSDLATPWATLNAIFGTEKPLDEDSTAGITGGGGANEAESGGGGAGGGGGFRDEEDHIKTPGEILNGAQDILDGILNGKPKPEEQPTIQDTTQNGIESAINGTDIMQFMEEQQAKQWEREDAIRAETQAREDTAMQRAVEDARKAGINPNLMNIQPAASGGGITSATGLEYQTYQAEMKEFLTLIEQEIENEFKGDEGKKDRWNQLFSSLIMALMFKK